MQLKGYLSDNKITVRQFSVMSDIPEDTLHKYIYKVRIPNKQNMKIIYQNYFQLFFLQIILYILVIFYQLLYNAF